MADKTNIEWTDASWNPIVGCSIVSPGCTNCYAMDVAARLLDGNDKAAHYAGTTTRAGNGAAIWTGKVALAPDHILTQPLRWTKPRRIFVNSMGDLFHEAAPDDWIDRVFAVMALCPQHTFQILTKRPERMLQWFRERWQGQPEHRISGRVTIAAGKPTGRKEQVQEACWTLIADFDLAPPERDDLWTPDGSLKAMKWNWPLSNVWLGVSAEDQRRADERIPILLDTPAVVRFVSAEPLLGAINFHHVKRHEDGEVERTNWLSGSWDTRDGDHYRYGHRLSRLDWVIVGGESGRDARPFHLTWAFDLVEACAEARVPIFVKQLGAHVIDDTYGAEPTCFKLKDRAGGEPDEWPEELRVRKFAEAFAEPETLSCP